MKESVYFSSTLSSHPTSFFFGERRAVRGEAAEAARSASRLAALGEAGLGAGEADRERAVAGAAAEAGQVDGRGDERDERTPARQGPRHVEHRPAWPADIIGTSTKCGAVSAPATATAAPLPGDMTGGPGEWPDEVLLDAFVDV